MTEEGLSTVLETGRTKRTEYYKQRMRGLGGKQRHSFANLFANVSHGDGLDGEDIISYLSQTHGAENAQEISLRAVEKGVISSRDAYYHMPIPSMQNWLVSKYAIESTRDTPSQSPVKGQQLSIQGKELEVGGNGNHPGKPDPPSKSKGASDPSVNSKDRDSRMKFELGTEMICRKIW